MVFPLYEFDDRKKEDKEESMDINMAAEVYLKRTESDILTKKIELARLEVSKMRHQIYETAMQGLFIVAVVGLIFSALVQIHKSIQEHEIKKKELELKQ